MDERFRWAMPDLAYNYTLHQQGFQLYYTPTAQVVHFGGQTASQDVLRALHEQCQGLIDFSDAYDYFGKSRFTKALVRFGVRARYYSKVLGYYLSSDKRVIKGPGAPSKEIAAQTARLVEPGAREGNRKDREDAGVVSYSQSGSDAKSLTSQ
jgi:GT2 family glycosyltransferase